MSDKAFRVALGAVLSLFVLAVTIGLCEVLDDCAAVIGATP